mgnify:CR=1 FL=1
MHKKENESGTPKDIELLTFESKHAFGPDDFAYDSQGKRWKKISPWSEWRNVTDWREVVSRLDFECLSPVEFRRVIPQTVDEESVPLLVNYLRDHLPQYLECLRSFAGQATEGNLTADEWAGDDYFMSHALDEKGQLTQEFRRGMLALAAYFRDEERTPAP